jgi:hypothetical protein
MSFINLESGIKLSETGKTAYVGCDFLITENGLKYINTERSQGEDAKRLKPEGDCLPITDYNCSFDRITVSSGEYVTIRNTCNMPIKFTGFKNSDPDRFSLFSFPDYSGFAEYNTGNTRELPFTINPDEKVIIDTFFHPYYDELLNGKAGTLENRNGDRFEAEISILPGFNVPRCEEDVTSILWWEENEDCDLVLSETEILSYGPAMQLFEDHGRESIRVRDEPFFSDTEDAQYFKSKGSTEVTLKFNSKSYSAYCSPSFKIEGEFICFPADKGWMSNNDNFVYPNLSDLPEIQAQYLLKKKKTIELNTADDNSVENVFTGLRDISKAYASTFDNMNPGWYETYGNLGITGSIGAFNYLVNEVISVNQHDDINNLLQSSLPPTQINYNNRVIEVSYDSNNIDIINIDGYSWTGMFISTKPISNAQDIQNQTVFFNAEIIPGPRNDVRIFVVDSGDYNAYQMEEV